MGYSQVWTGVRTAHIVPMVSSSRKESEFVWSKYIITLQALLQVKLCVRGNVCTCVLFILQCCMDDNYKMAKMLLAKGAGVGLVDGDLWAPLHVACSCAGQDLVLLLLEVCGCHLTHDCR